MLFTVKILRLSFVQTLFLKCPLFYTVLVCGIEVFNSPSPEVLHID